MRLLKLYPVDVTFDIQHAAVGLFAPNAVPRALLRYATKHRPEKGTVRRFVFADLREATALVTSRKTTKAWIAAQKLKPPDVP